MNLTKTFGIVLGLKDSWNKATIISPESCFKIITFINIFSIVCIYLIKLDKIYYLIQSR